jgi:protein-disulfide isomerase
VADVAELQAGAEFGGDFVVERALSRGGMGAVYVAMQRSTGRRRALKLMHPVLASDEKARERFVREARVGALISSDHVVEVIAAGVDGPTRTPWLAMELLEGEDLATRAQLAPVHAAELGVILKQVCHALAAAHAAGIVHRDLKPENVFLCRSKSVSGDLSVKVLDFGIAKMVAESGGASTGFIGTPAYMAPEQSDGSAVTPAADVWALGLMTFALLTGRSYWRTANTEGASPMKLLTEVATDRLEPASARAQSQGGADRLPAGFDAWFAKAVARDPKDRYSNAAEAWAALAPLLGQSADAALGFADTVQGAQPPQQVHRRSLFPLLALVLGIAVAVAAAVLWPRGAAPDPVTTVDPNNPALLYDVPLAGSPSRGPERALVTVVEFGDLECPFTKLADASVQAAMARHPGDIRVIYKDFPLGIHPHAELASWLLAQARSEKGEAGFWKTYDAVLAAQPLTADKLSAIGKDLGLDPERLAAALARTNLPDGTAGDVTLASALAVAHTPTFFINGRRHEGASGLDAELDKAVANTRARFPGSAENVYAQLTHGGVRSIPREVRTVPAPPQGVLSRGTSAPGAVELVEFCAYNDFPCVLAERSLERVLERYKDRVHFVFWDNAPSTDAEAIAMAAAVHAVTDPEPQWKLHDSILLRQLDAIWEDRRVPFTPQALRELAIAAGAAPEPYDYELRVNGPGLVRKLSLAAQQAGITESCLYIDGERHEPGEPRSLLEQAIERALAQRAKN